SAQVATQSSTALDKRSGDNPSKRRPPGSNRARRCPLEHHPEKWGPVFRRRSSKRIERNGDSKKSHHALAFGCDHAPKWASLRGPAFFFPWRPFKNWTSISVPLTRMSSQRR